MSTSLVCLSTTWTPELPSDIPILLFFFFSKVNNAGYVLGVEHVGDISDADIEGMFGTNVFGLISITQLLVKGSR